MIRSMSHIARLGLAAALLVSATGAAGQQWPNAAARLSSHLRELAGNPNSLNALIGAGQASLAVGDVNAALGFFARADEIAPRNGQVKAGLARALLRNDNPRDALRMFDAARDLGVPDAEIAGDRGLAYDLRGDAKRAQRDYALALARGPNDEVTRRYALSLGISGDRETALKLLDPLLYKRDQAAWRARAFVMALTNDQAGANQIVRQVMPERMAVAMTPFLARLPNLKPAEKAAAVHLGEMPSDGGMRYAAVAPVNVASMQPAPQQVAPQQVAQAPFYAPENRDPRRRPGQPVQMAQAQTTPPPAQSQPATAVAPLPDAERGDLTAIMRDIRAAAQEDGQRRFGTSPRATATAPTRVAQATTPPARATKPAAPAPKAKGGPDKDVVDPKAKLDPKAKVDPKAKLDPKAKGKAKAEEEPDPKDAKTAKGAKGKSAKETKEAKAPARTWVQVASGNASAMPREWDKLKAKAPAALKGRTPSIAPGRLLVGPFETDAQARAYVNQLRKAGVSAFPWDSAAGQDVDKLGAK